MSRFAVRILYSFFCFQTRDALLFTESYIKLETKALVKSCQPSTRTKRRSLQGVETTTGGIIIMPSDIRIVDTTRSISRNGMYKQNPMMNAVFNSLIMNAGIITFKEISASRISVDSEISSEDKSKNSCRSLVLVLCSMNPRNSVEATFHNSV